MHLSFGEMIPDCKKCEGEPELRAQYGCDAPAARPVLAVSCPCETGCERCTRGARPLYRCPGKLTEGRPEIRAAFWYCVQYEQHALLPWDGGLDEQAAGFLELLHAYSTERKYVEKLPEKKKEDNARRFQEIRMKAALEKRGG